MKKETKNRVQTITDRFVESYYKLYSLRLVKSKADFCRSTGIYYTNFWSVENGSRQANLENIFLLVTTYNISAEWLITGKGKTFK